MDASSSFSNPASAVLLRRFLPVVILLPAILRAAELHPIAKSGDHQLHPSLEMTLYAREPDIVDPVALTFDAEGRMFVVEMRDYPYGFGANRRPGGTVRLLEDANGDGRADRSVVFAEGLSFPTSIAPWNGGVIVTAPPEVIFLKDTDGDGRADQREVLLKGFTLGVTDSNVNGLRWGLDNRLHGVNGGNGGEIVSTRKPGAPIPLRSFDFSFNPATGHVAPTYHTSGGFGLVFDDWGRSFVTYNINHIQQRMIPVRYLNRSQGLPPIEAVASISDHGEMSRIFPFSEPETRVNHPEQSGHFSSAGGMGFVGWSGYRGDLAGSILICDVVGNLVHRDLLVEDGPIFSARRAPGEATSEFFASRDRAFRPVGVELGPDGALYLIDMQRDVIEHPDYIPDPVKAKLDLRAGQDRGRIYRMTPKGGLPSAKRALRGAKIATLVEALGHSNQWWRVTAQRLLVERGDQSSVPALRKMARNRNPLGRLHAFWTLHTLAALDESMVLGGLSDPHPGLRENALILAESLLPGSANLRQRLLSLAGDDSARVRFQAALTIGEISRLHSMAPLPAVFLRDYQHRWARLAVLSSISVSETGAEELLDALLTDTGFLDTATPDKLDAVREVVELFGARISGQRGLAWVLSRIDRPNLALPWQLAVLDGLQSGLTRSPKIEMAGPEVPAHLDSLGRRPSPALVTSTWRLSRTLRLPETDAQRSAMTDAMAKIRDTSLPATRRIENVRLLAFGSYSNVAGTLYAVLDGVQPAAVQEAALDVLGSFKEAVLATNLVARWRLLAPSARPGALNLLLQRIPAHGALIDALESGAITLGELNLDLEQRRRLLRESSPALMARAAKLIGDGEYSNRKSVVDEWLGKLPTNGDPARGQIVFAKVCSQCHLAAGSGHSVGPDLGSLAHRSVEDLLSNILDPNMAINPSYVSYSAETTSGEMETGILQSESADAVVLLQAGGRKVVLPRREIRRLQSSGLSLMPEGLEAGLTPGDLRDLIAFLNQDFRQ
jgi:putative membrane-bound dehydrogenase-like protein